MGDKRTDPGQYYPGGKVVSQHGVAPPQIIVQWSDVQGKPQIAPLPDRYKDGDVKEKVNEIASKFATVVVAALIGWTACADITVQKKRKDQIYNDEQVVVDVTGSGVGVNTNAVRDIVREQLSTNGIRSVDGAARPLPKYLHIYNADDSYPDAAQEYYRSRGNGKADGGCSSVRDGGFLSRNFDYPLDYRAEFVVKMSAGPNRFASVGVAQVGTNLTEQMVTSGKPEYSARYKWLPGATVDGINENGVACNINVVDGLDSEPQWDNPDGDIHPLAAIRWALDNATNALHAASNLAKRVKFPAGWVQNFHYMVCDETSTYIVENGHYAPTSPSAYTGRPIMTNYRVLYQNPHGVDGRMYTPWNYSGPGAERSEALEGGANITNVWYTNAYSYDTSWDSDFGYNDTLMATSKVLWAQKPKEAHRGESFNGTNWWQSVHTSVYDLTNLVLRIAVQEVDDWYVFQVPSSGAKIDAYTRAETDERIAGKVDGPTVAPSTEESASGKAADAKDTGDQIDMILNYMANKADKVPGTTEGNIASFDASGNLTDSEYSIGRIYMDLLPFEWSLDQSSTFHGIANRAKSLFNAESNDELKLLTREEVGDPRWGCLLFGIIPRYFAYTSELPQDYANVSNAAMWASNTVAGIKIDHTDATFSNEVLAVGIDTNVLAAVGFIASSTNAVAQIGEFYAALESIGITPAEGGMTLGGLLAAIVALLVRVKRTLAKVAENDGKPTDTFAGELLGKQVAKEAVRYAFDSPTSSTTTTGTVETTAVTANSNTVASVTIPAAASGNTPSLAITVPDALGPSDVRDLIIYAVNADTANDCPIGIVGGTPVPQDGAEAKVPKGSRVYIAISKMPTTGEWFIQAVKLTAAA